MLAIITQAGPVAMPDPLGFGPIRKRAMRLRAPNFHDFVLNSRFPILCTHFRKCVLFMLRGLSGNFWGWPRFHKGFPFKSMPKPALACPGRAFCPSPRPPYPRPPIKFGWQSPWRAPLLWLNLPSGGCFVPHVNNYSYFSMTGCSGSMSSSKFGWWSIVINVSEVN